MRSSLTLASAALLLAVVVAVIGAARLPRQASSASSAIIFPDHQRRRTTPAPVGGCVDWAGRAGRCVPFSMCPGLRALLVKQGRTAQTVRRLRAGDCGVWRGGLLVCCGRGTPPPPPPTPSTRLPPEQHPNLPVLERGEAGCGIGFQANIFGGKKTEVGEFPWIAALAYSHPSLTEPEVNCGGALIGLQYVLTAAHCVTNLPEQFALHSVRLGEHNLATDPDCGEDSAEPQLCLPPPQVFNVTETVIHTRYNDPVRDQHDIALLRLDRPAVENGGVAKICLPLGAMRLADHTGRRATVAGFGLTENGVASDVQLAVRLPVLPQENCSREIEARGRQIGPGQLCAGGEVGEDSCVGDSGGPLFVPGRFGPPYHVIGVTSFGPTTCGVGAVPGVYTRVTEYLDWILDNVHE